MAPTPCDSPSSHTVQTEASSLANGDDATISAASSTAAPAQNTRQRSSHAQSSAVVNRRPHAKSRTGCRTCKKRRIKCDEHKPSCRNCIKHAVPCDFAKTHPAGAAAAAASQSGDGGMGSPSLLPPGGVTASVSGDVNLMDLELMHNFTTFTCTTMANDPAVRQLMRTTAVHMAVDCEYLMRSILAVSALHLSRYRPGKKDLYVGRAMQHHQAASSAAIELMTDLRAEDCENLHIFSMLTIYYALGCPFNSADYGSDCSLVPHWLRLLHGMEPILRMLNPSEYRGVLTPLFEFGRRRMQPYLRSTPPRDPSLLADLQMRIHRTCADTDLVPVYDDMIEQLRRMLGLMLAPRSSRGDNADHHAHARGGVVGVGVGEGSGGVYGAQIPGGAGTGAGAGATGDGSGSDAGASPPLLNLEAWDILTWQWTQGKDFLPLLELDPAPQEAVVIFAHCLVVLRKLENQWWLEGWAEHLMAKTWEVLDEEHRHWVGWAAEEMGWIPPRR